MAELLWKNMLVCAALEDQYLKDEVYKPNCKSVYQLNLQKQHLCYVNESGETNYGYRLLLMMETTQYKSIVSNKFPGLGRKNCRRVGGILLEMGDAVTLGIFSSWGVANVTTVTFNYISIIVFLFPLNVGVSDPVFIKQFQFLFTRCILPVSTIQLLVPVTRYILHFA